ncbi:MAG: radical SAM protein [Candidatus Bathyarchaeota archaeon]|nr:radical SAM protein [Candidatus Bathyarchaeota archaeon]
MEQIAICEESAASSSLLRYAKAEAQKKSCARMLQSKPINGGGAHFRFNRIDLSVKSECNVGCNYCDPSLTLTEGKVLTSKEAIERVRIAANEDPRLRVIDISGTGDALSSEVTFKTLRLIAEEFPHFTRCITTNGLLLPKKLPLLEELGVSAIRVAVNAVDADVGAKMYSYVRLNGRTLRGKEAFEVLSLNQLEGIRNASDAGMMVEVNTLCVPEVNSAHMVEVAKIVRSLGAYRMNVVPVASKSSLHVPTVEELRYIQTECDTCVSPQVVLHTPPTVSCILASA